MMTKFCLADTFHINPQLQLHVAQQDKVGSWREYQGFMLLLTKIHGFNLSTRQLVQRKDSQLDNQFNIRIEIKQSLLFCPLCTWSTRRSCICPSESANMYHVNVTYWSKVSIIYHMSVFSQRFQIYVGCIVINFFWMTSYRKVFKVKDLISIILQVVHENLKL